MSIEAMKEMVDALIEAASVIEDLGYESITARAAIKTGLQAIEEAEKPIAVQHLHEWFRTGGMKPGQIRCISCGQWGQEQIEDEWVELTDEEVKTFAQEHLYCEDSHYNIEDGLEGWSEFAKAIDAKLRSKNGL